MEKCEPSIYLISTGRLNAENFYTSKQSQLKIFAEAIEGGISHIQIREKNLPAKLLFELTSEAVSLKSNFPVKILVNDRADVALAAGADGVHLTSNSINAGVIRKFFPRDFTIGVSTHSIEEINNAKADGASFVVFGPVFEPISKSHSGKPIGIHGLWKAIEVTPNFPVIALGGINLHNFSDTLNAGAAGIAGIGMFEHPGKASENIAFIRSYGRSDD